MAGDKEQLVQDLAELKKAANVAYKFDKREAAADGRPFDIAEWLLGGNIDKKYPGGPAFKVRDTVVIAPHAQVPFIVFGCYAAISV
jgi:hypothetical protein